MRSHLRTLQKELKGFNELLNKSGFGWDYIKNTVIQSTTCWDKLLSDKKDADKYKSFQFLDTKDIDDVYDPDMSGLVDEDEHLGDIEENPSIPLTDSTRKRSTPAPPLEKQQHGTKVKKAYKLDELLEGLSGTLSGLHASINHRKKFTTLCEEIMKMEGYNDVYLQGAWCKIMNSPTETQFFLIGDAIDRKTCLDKLRESIGDV
ncbi:hypothetical protein GIB67_028469 [Kingdonia uniflora]|uniref:Myb/SANT-like domain-containing protein n=1 Tax=Kingdonia uniflora TaxID=39325 RepID=A0A7J7P167_9MAGN|nr:hypothetical protein GIB67_028469 [Kingdonia uniflora]